MVKTRRSDKLPTMKIIRYHNSQQGIGWACIDAEQDPTQITEAQAVDGGPYGPWKVTGDTVRVDKLLAPVQPTAIMCIGLNYREHAEETGQDLPKHPVLFMKNPAALAHPGEPIVLPRGTVEKPEVDYEVELAVVIGRDAKNVPQADALDYVAGYTVGNDVSARRWQKHSCGGQWVRGKSFDSFCPLGPCLVTSDIISDPQTLHLTTELNGRVMQDSGTSDMIFTVAQLISELSQDLTLRAGTVILTGTPSGVGVACDPKVFLKPGDEVVVTIDRIGSLRSQVIAGSAG